MKIKGNKIFLFIILILGIWCLIKVISHDSYAYYGGSNEIPIINATIGNFAGGQLPEEVIDADFIIQIYLQDQSNDEKYILVNKIPIYGFIINESKTNCKPKDSTYSNYKLENNKLSINIKEEAARQVICKLYYDTNPDANGTIYALVEDANYGTIKYKNELYRFTNVINENYNMEGYDCTNKNSNTTVTFENNKIKLITNKPNVCYVYFKVK